LTLLLSSLTSILCGLMATPTRSAKHDLKLSQS